MPETEELFEESTEPFTPLVSVLPEIYCVLRRVYDSSFQLRSAFDKGGKRRKIAHLLRSVRIGIGDKTDVRCQNAVQRAPENIDVLHVYFEECAVVGGALGYLFRIGYHHVVEMRDDGDGVPFDHPGKSAGVSSYRVAGRFDGKGEICGKIEGEKVRGAARRGKTMEARYDEIEVFEVLGAHIYIALQAQNIRLYGVEDGDLGVLGALFGD